MEKIVIVGAGPSGLYCAYTLKKRGFDPLILEAADFIGWEIRRISAKNSKWKSD
jgi:flavin-dependent dehydrogenase